MQGELPNPAAFLTALQDGAADAASRVADAVRDVTPVRSGALADSLTGEAENTAEGATISVVSDVPQARYTLEGRGPIDKNPGTLHFFIEGEEFFRHHVDAAAPSFFPEQASEGIDTAVDALIDAALGAL